MTLHFIHIGKTGGSAVKHVLKKSKHAHWPSQSGEGIHETPYGRIVLHPHKFHLKDVPEGDHAFFCMRDPVDRFFSAWYSRVTEGRPRYYVPWSDTERRAFELYPTPQAIVADLAAPAGDERREQAEWAMRQIIHMKPVWRKLASASALDGEMTKIVYIAMQETLDQDFENLKRLLNLPDRLKLPQGKAAHKRTEPVDKSLDDAGREALQRFYAKDYELIQRCNEVRYERGWTTIKPPPREPSGRGGVLGRLLRS